MEPNPLFGIYGTGGYGREVMPVAREQLLILKVPVDRLVFITDDKDTDTINGQHVMTYQEFLAFDASERYVSIAIANSQVRETLANRLQADGVNPWTVKATNAVVFDDNDIGPGAILGSSTTITSNARIGKYFHANIYSYVAHDCVIGDFVTFAPSVHCNGNVVIEDHAYIGTGALLKQGTHDAPLVIGRGATVGMGAVVTHSVPPQTVVVGNPARPLR